MNKKMWRSMLSMALAACMMFSLCGNALALTVNAGEDEVINYVSLGASNTNGYGHRGYLPPEVTEDPLAASKAEMNVYGYDRKPENAYPAQIAKALSRSAEVELDQLAISSMRTAELRILLDNDYYGDDYTKWRFTGGQEWFEIALEGGMDALREAYQDAVKDAELITVDIGWNDFGVYAFNNIKTILADGHYWKEPKFDDILTEDEQISYDNLKKIALNYLKSNLGMADAGLQGKLEKMADVLAYATMGACYHFDIVLEKIYELNPDAIVVSINIQNLADGLVVDFEGTELELGELYGKLIEMTDLYRATRSPYADRYLYADAEDVETFLDEIVAWDGDPATLGDDMKDCFDMYDDGLYVRSIVEYMMVGQALSGLFQGFRDMAAGYGLEVFKNDTEYTYEFALTRSLDQLLSLNLGALDLQNPAGDDADVEAYGQAVSKHLKNLRGEEVNAEAYDYVFDNLLVALNAQKGELESQKDNLIKNNIEVPAELEAGIAQLTQAIEVIVPGAKAEFAAKLEGVYNTYHNTLNYAYDVVATVVQYAANIDALEINADTLNGFNSAADGMMGIVLNDFINGAQAKFYYELEKNGVQATGAPEVPEYVLDESKFDPALEAILVLAVRYELGSSFYAHPNIAGHEQIAAAVFEALENEFTAEDHSDAELTAAWNWLMDYAQENYPEAYDVFMQAADYVESEEFTALCEQLKTLHRKMDSATTPEQKAKLADAAYELMTRLQEIAAMATSDKVENINYYVSIGDSTLSGYGLEGYTIGSFNGEGQKIGNEAPILLAKKLFGDDYEAHFEKLDKGGLRTNDILVWLGLDEYKDDFYDRYTIDENAIEKNTEHYQNLYRTEIEKADLITLTLGGGDVSTFIEKQIIALRETGSVYKLDWTKYFPEADLTEVYGHIETVTQLLDGTLPEIMGVEAEDLAPLVAESFLYGFVGYVNNYSRIVDRIHEMNPDAHIVLVGYFNTVDDMVLPVTIQGETIQLPIGTMLGMLVETSNANTLSYALAHNEYTTYVSTSEATTILDEQGIFDYESRLNGLIAETWQTHAGPEGHKYIADQIYNAITTEYTNEEIAVETLTCIYDALVVLAEVAQEEIEEYMASEEGQALLAEIERIKGEMEVAAGEALVELEKELLKAEADLQAYLAEVVEQLPGKVQEAYNALVEAVMAAVEEYAPQAADAVYNYLYNNPAEVIAFVAEYGDDTLAFVEEYAEEILAVLGFLAKTFGDEIVEYVMANPEEVLETMVEWVDEHGENAWALIMVYCEELGLCDKIADMDEQLKDALEDLYEQVEAIIAGKLEDIDLEGMKEALENLKEAIENEIANVMGEIEKVKNEIEKLEQQLEDLKAQLEAKYEELKNASEELKAEIEQAIADIEAAIETVEKAIEELENIIENAQAVIEELIETAEKIGNAIDAIADAIVKATEDVNAAIDAVQEAMEELAELIPYVEELMEKLNEFVDDAQQLGEDIVNAVEEYIDELGELMNQLGEEAEKLYEQIVEAVEEAKAFVEEAIAEIEKLIAEVEAKVEQAIADFKAAYDAAVTGEYHVTADSYYVAIADANAQGYEALLAEELGVENAVLNAQLAEEMLMNLAMNPEWQAEIAKADLVSVSLNNTFVIDQVNAILVGEPTAEIDWSLYVGEEAAAGIEAAIAEIEAYMAENVAGEFMGISVPELMTVLVESYVYDCVSAAFNYHEVANAIQAINPEAEVVLVGMVNPIDQLTIVAEDVEIPMGDVYTAIVELSNLHQTVVAMLGDNRTFVNVADAATAMDAVEVIDVNNVQIPQIMALIDGGTMPTEEGHEFIKDAILNAETVTTCEECAGEAARENEVPATCTEPGSYDEVVYCEVCGAELSRVTVPVDALGHTEAEAVVENEIPAKCEVPGSYDEVVYCEVCGEELSRVTKDIPALEHEDAADDGDHICDNEGCGEVVGDHVDADNNGICDDCGTVINPGQGDDDEDDDNDRPSRPSISDDEEEECDGGKNCPSKKFVDVDQNQWYHEAVDFSIVEGLMNGTSETTYEPLSTTTRAMIVTMLYRLEGEPEVDHEIGFEDVAADTWYTEAIRWAEAEGIVNGYSETEFGPNDYVTREQMVTILHRYAEYKGVATDKRDDLKAFPDAEAVSAWALDAMQWAVEAELIEGMNGVLNPTGDANRAQIATVFMRMIQNILD